MLRQLCSQHTLSRRVYTQTSRRTLFTLPDLSSFSPFKLEPTSYHERKILPYNPRQLYDVVADVSSYPQFVPFCTGSRVLESRIEEENAGRKTVMKAELTVGFLTFKESYVSEVTCVPHKSVEAVASSTTPLFKTLSTTWSFQPVTSGTLSRTNALQTNAVVANGAQTLVTLDLAYAFANPVHASISSTFFGQVSKLMVEAFEKRCADVYGSGIQ